MRSCDRTTPNPKPTAQSSGWSWMKINKTWVAFFFTVNDNGLKDGHTRTIDGMQEIDGCKEPEFPVGKSLDKGPFGDCTVGLSGHFFLHAELLQGLLLVSEPLDILDVVKEIEERKNAEDNRGRTFKDEEVLPAVESVTAFQKGSCVCNWARHNARERSHAKETSDAETELTRLVDARHLVENAGNVSTFSRPGTAIVGSNKRFEERAAVLLTLEKAGRPRVLQSWMQTP